MTSLLISHPSFLEHDTGAHHPERADRLRAVLAALDDDAFAGLLKSYKFVIRKKYFLR